MNKLTSVTLLLATLACFTLTGCLDRDTLRDFKFHATRCALSSDDPDKRAEALYVIASKYLDYDHVVLPEITDMAKTDASADVRLGALYAIPWLMYPHKRDQFLPLFIEALKDEDPRVRKQAAYQLSDFTQYVDRISPELLRMLDDEVFNVRLEAAKTLGYLKIESEKAVDILIEALEYPQHRGNVFNALRSYGPLAGEAVPHLLGILKGEPFREYPDDLIFTIEGEDEEGKLPADEFYKFLETTMPDSLLLEELEIENPDRTEVYVGHNPDWITLLLHWGEYRYGLVSITAVGGNRFRVANTLGAISTEPEVIEALTNALSDADVKVRIYALAGLKDTGEAAVKAVPAITWLLQEEENDRVLLNAAKALKSIGPEARDAVPALEKVLDDFIMSGAQDIPYYVSATAQAIVSIESDNCQDFDSLVEFLEHKNPYVRRYALDPLNGLSPGRALPDIVKMHGDPNHMVRQQVLYYLNKAEKPDYLQYFIEALDDEDEEVRRWAAYYLSSMNIDISIAAPALIKTIEKWAFKEGEPYEREFGPGIGTEGVVSHSVVALGNIGPGAADAVPLLVELLEWGGQYLKIKVIKTLGDIGANGDEVIPILIELLQSDDYTTRWVAAKALGEFGPAAAEALPLLREFASNAPYSYIEDTVLDAIGKIEGNSAER